MATRTGFEGMAQITITAVLKAEHKDRVVNFYRNKHKPFMQRTHQALGLLAYTVTVNDETKDPFNPDSEKTGRIIVQLTEIYKQSEAIQKHMEIAQSDPTSGFSEWVAINELCKDGGAFFATTAQPILVSLLPQDLEVTFPN